jgi:hypothetical protein
VILQQQLYFLWLLAAHFFSLLSIGGGGQVYLEDAAWSLSGSRTVAMGRSRMWIEGHLRLSASGGPTNSVTSGCRLAYPRFSPLMEAATVIKRIFRPGCARRGCEEAWPCSRRRRTPAPQLKEDCQVVMWQLFAGVTCKQRDPGGGGEGRRACSTTSPPQPSQPRRCRAGSWRRLRRRRRPLRLQLWRRIPTRTPTSGQMGEAGRAAVPPRRMDCGWGDHPHWVVRSGPPGGHGVLVGGTRRVPGPSPIPGVAWLLLGTLLSGRGSLRTRRKR